MTSKHSLCVPTNMDSLWRLLVSPRPLGPSKPHIDYTPKTPFSPLSKKTALKAKF